MKSHSSFSAFKGRAESFLGHRRSQLTATPGELRWPGRILESRVAQPRAFVPRALVLFERRRPPLPLPLVTLEEERATQRTIENFGFISRFGASHTHPVQDRRRHSQPPLLREGRKTFVSCLLLAFDSSSKLGSSSTRADSNEIREEERTGEGSNPS